MRDQSNSFYDPRFATDIKISCHPVQYNSGFNKIPEQKILRLLKMLITSLQNLISKELINYIIKVKKNLSTNVELNN